MAGAGTAILGDGIDTGGKRLCSELGSDGGGGRERDGKGVEENRVERARRAYGMRRGWSRGRGREVAAAGGDVHSGCATGARRLCEGRARAAARMQRGVCEGCDGCVVGVRRGEAGMHEPTPRTQRGTPPIERSSESETARATVAGLASG